MSYRSNPLPLYLPYRIQFGEQKELEHIRASRTLIICASVDKTTVDKTEKIRLALRLPATTSMSAHAGGDFCPRLTQELVILFLSSLKICP